MRSRKELKKNGKENLKKHYLIFLLLCLIAAFIGSEFVNSLSITEIKIAVDNTQVLPNSFKRTVAGTVQKVENISSKVKNQKKLFASSRGVFASVINAADSGSLYLTLVYGIRSIAGTSSCVIVISIILSFLLYFLFWVLVVNTYRVILRRMFLEGRIYEKISLKNCLFLLRIQKWHKASLTMLKTSIYEILWTFTIVGGVIKRYSYFLVPYIVAENPNIKSKDAINLSRTMMNGHKFECFILELSFIGWRILSILTIGLSNIFFTNAYFIATFCEYYTDLRKVSKEKNIFNSQLLCDRYLYEKADKKILEDTYCMDLSNIAIKKNENRSIKDKIENIFGINISSVIKEKENEENIVNEIKINYIKDELNAKMYPSRLYIIPKKHKKNGIEVVNYLRRYNISSLILMFFLFSFIGWLWEVTLHLLKDGTFVNRGVMHGPWLPIYGAGGILVLVLLNKLRKKPLLEFLSIIVLCGLVEYFASYYLEIANNGIKWWDYSGYFLNLNGRICAEGLLVFGLGGLYVVYFLAPLLDDLIKRVNYKVLMMILFILIIMFTIDKIYSSKYPNKGTGITDYSAAKNIIFDKL